MNDNNISDQNKNNSNNYNDNQYSSSTPSSSSSCPSSFVSFDQNSQIYSANYSSIFPQKKLSKRLTTRQNFTEFEKENIECMIIFHCMSSSSNKNYTLSKLMSVIKSAYFNNITIDSINCYLIDDIHRVKACLKKMQESGYLDITLSNLPTSTAG